MTAIVLPILFGVCARVVAISWFAGDIVFQIITDAGGGGPNATPARMGLRRTTRVGSGVRTLREPSADQGEGRAVGPMWCEWGVLEGHSSHPRKWRTEVARGLMCGGSPLHQMGCCVVDGRDSGGF